VLVAALSAATVIGAIGAGRAAPGTVSLRVTSPFIRDAEGRVLILHGVNAVWKRPPFAPRATRAGFTARDAAFLASSGFDVVRLGVLLEGVMPKPGVIDHRYLDRIDRVVKLLALRHIWVLLDFHQDQYNERFQGEGMPAWAVHDDGLPNDAHQGFPGNEFSSTALNHTYDNFWSNTAGLWDSYRDAWKAVARRFRGEPYVLGYDVFNEPWPGSQWPTCFMVDCSRFDATLLQFQEHVLAGIRSVDRRHLVFFEPQQLFDFGAPSSFGHVADPRIGLAWHDYCSATLFSPFGLPDGPDCLFNEDRVMQNARAQVKAMGAGSLLTEFGATDDLTDIGRVASLADRYMVGWTYWQYKGWRDPTGNPSGESMFRSDRKLRSLKRQKATLLIRTYPQAVAGTPVRYSYDPSTGAFSLVYRADPSILAPTRIFVPVARRYHGRYRVIARGATVLSRPDAPILLLRNAGASRVTVRIVRARP